jgi:type I restriction enzyme S subunit
VTVWPVVALEDVCALISDGSHNPPRGVEHSDYPMLSSRDIQDDEIVPVGARYLTRQDFLREDVRTSLAAGDVLLTIVGTIGRCAVYDGVPKNATLQRSVAVLRPRGSLLDSRYLMYILQSKRGLFESEAQGAAQKGFYLKQLRGVHICLPPLEEQKRIVAKLDEFRCLLDSATQKTSLAIETGKVLGSALVDQEMDRAAAQFGEVPLASVYLIARGGSPRPIQQYLTDDPEGINWIKIGDATRTGKYITDTEQRIRPEGLKKSRFVRVDDLLLSNSMSFGRPYIMKTEGCIHDGWLVLSPGSTPVDSEYMYYALGSSRTYAQFDKFAQGTTVRNLNIDSAGRALVPLPDLHEQRTIAARLQEAESQLEDLRNVNGRLKAKLNDLQAAIFREALGVAA